MEVILTQDIEHLGSAGEVVTVKNGYGRNYLLPQGLAIAATRRNKAKLEHDRAAIERRVAKQRADAQAIADRLNGMTLKFERRVGEDDKLFGSVTSRDIADQLAVAGIEIDHRKIVLPEPIKSLGKFEVPVKVGSGVEATLKFWVVAQAD
ncbi:MAG: 50S ribosomal protein L9 [Deltaproteobacteria bacterium]|nr:MAG: 50S ribosomal protein L9 [Deltaproteobacteria bacterium]